VTISLEGRQDIEKYRRNKKTSSDSDLAEFKVIQLHKIGFFMKPTIDDFVSIINSRCMLKNTASKETLVFQT